MVTDELLLQLGQQIRLIRKSKGLTQLDLSKKAGVNHNYIGMLERGERNPTYLLLRRIAASLDVSLSSLFSELN